MRIRAAAAVLTAAAVLFSLGCYAKKRSKSEKGPDKPMSWSVEQRKLDEVTPLKGEEQVYIKRDEDNDDIILIIQGVLGADAIDNEDEALELIASYSEEMGFNDVYSDLRYVGAVDYPDKTDYRFEQYYGDEKVLGSYVELTVGKTYGNRPVILNSTYSDTWNFDNRPKVSTIAAMKCAAEKYKVSKETAPELVILRGPVLAWKVAVDDSRVSFVYIDATNGNTVRKDITE